MNKSGFKVFNLKNPKKIGVPPGALVYRGREKDQHFELDTFNYSKESLIEERDISCDKLSSSDSNNSVNWINAIGLNHPEKIGEVGAIFNIHPLIIEDLLNTNHRPKVEEQENYIFLTLKMLKLIPGRLELDIEQVSFVILKGHLISFQEKTGDLFDPIRDRIRKGKGRVRSFKEDYLMFLLIDIIVDHYSNVIEAIGERIIELEEEVQTREDEGVMGDIQNLKSLLIKVRKAVIPLKELLGTLLKNEPEIISEGVLKYYRDVYDHTISTTESLEMYREMLGNIRDLHLSNLSLKMNKIMQVLTIISSIFIPLTFIAGVYGMNFKNIPELESDNGYFIVWVVMVVTALLLLLFFKRKKWL